MIFVVAGSSRERLTELTKLLLSIFPGSTIYRHIDPLRVSKDVFNNKVRGVFLESEIGTCSGIDLMLKLRKRKSDILIYILSETEGFCSIATKAGADGCFLYPLDKETIKNALLTKQL